MRAFRVTSTDRAPELTDIPPPRPGPGEVRIRVAACALNFSDMLLAQGRYQERPALPFTLGMELSGTVEAVGDGVQSPAPGMRVAAIVTIGGLAEQAIVAADRCIPLPDGMGFEEAAALQIAYATSHLALLRRARLQAGETLLVTGAAGGAGLTAVEIGKLTGARVIALARGAEKLAAARAAGADHLIDSDSREGADLKATLRALGGIDVAYETIGGDIFLQALGAMRPEGRILTIGYAGGTIPQIPANLLLVKNLTAIGLYIGGYPGFCPDALRESLTEIMGWHAAGRIHPQISHILPLSQAAEALALLRDRKSTGKVVVRCDQRA
ncbi:MAG: NADPH:quinone oxidoreductase family protein [Rhodobacteraceae bacterium]|nr:NADPH:quinone oxidoreductase family protein [Paracoccaceae bacterium]